MTLRAKVTYRPKVSSWKSEPSCKKKPLVQNYLLLYFIRHRNKIICLKTH